MMNIQVYAENKGVAQMLHMWQCRLGFTEDNEYNVRDLVGWYAFAESTPLGEGASCKDTFSSSGYGKKYKAVPIAEFRDYVNTHTIKIGYKLKREYRHDAGKIARYANVAIEDDADTFTIPVGGEEEASFGGDLLRMWFSPMYEAVLNDLRDRVREKLSAIDVDTLGIRECNEVLRVFD